MTKDYIAKRRAATKRLKTEIRSMPEFVEAVAEVEQENQIANLMAEARERAGFTQAQVAAKMGIGQSALSRMERGNVTIKNFMRCLNVCGYALKLIPNPRVAACL